LTERERETRTIAEMRREYTAGGLNEAEAGDDPVALFARWFADARAVAEQDPVFEANVMTLATVGLDGGPAARIVLLKDFDESGFVFFTNYASDKARELAANPQATLVFHWMPLERQVRLRGRAERVSRAESEQYFATRPRGSQLGAWASPQSRPIDREDLEGRLADLEREYAGREVPCPSHWGGYRVVPGSVEFWQGRPSRLHDRLRYERQADRWNRIRLAP
jgi:pyridoxamine 5'-phosphate oxidase